MKKISIYVHIPFCAQKCNYCNFVSFCSSDEQREKYVDALCKQIKNSKLKGRSVNTIFFGGGTPNILLPNQLTLIYETIKQTFIINGDEEFTIECNPNFITDEMLDCFKQINVNRISVGVQSLFDDELKVLGRIHNSKGAINALKLIKSHGFKNVNADLLLALPNQTKRRVIKQINALLPYVTHLSVYSLILEENTPIYSAVQKNEIKLPSEEKSVKLYSSALKYLQKRGFYRYEVSNFAPKGYECKHNEVYWNLGEYVGFGLSAHSYLDGKRIANASDFNEYIANPNSIEFIEDLDFYQQKTEYIMLSLRTREGINLDEYQKLFNENLLNEKDKQIAKLLNEKLLILDGNRIYASDNGFMVLNQLILMLIN